MPPAIAVAQQFAFMVHLVMHGRPDAELAEPVQALLSELGVLDAGGVDLTTDGLILRAGKEEVSNAYVGVSDLVGQCHAHGLTSLYIATDASADELLLVAHAVGAAPVPGEGEVALRRSMIGVDRVIPTFATIVKFEPRPTRSLTPEDWGRVVVSEDAAARLSFAHVRRASGTVRDLFVRLLADPPPAALGPLLEQLFLALGDAVRDDHRGIVLEIFEFAADRCDAAPEGEVREMYRYFERRIIRPQALRPLCKLILAGGEVGRRTIDIARRIGAAAVDMILEMLADTDSRSERSALFNGLLTMRIDPGLLRHLMYDQRWFVARNAVDLAGKGARRELEDDVIAMTAHADERVRLAALHGLARIGTPKAIGTLQEAMRDPSPAVRAKAAAALGSLRRTLAMPMVYEALTREQDAGVLTALRVALGIHTRTPSPAAPPLVDERRSGLRAMMQ